MAKITESMASTQPGRVSEPFHPAMMRMLPMMPAMTRPWAGQEYTMTCMARNACVGGRRQLHGRWSRAHLGLSAPVGEVWVFAPQGPRLRFSGGVHRGLISLFVPCIGRLQRVQRQRGDSGTRHPSDWRWCRRDAVRHAESERVAQWVATTLTPARGVSREGAAAEARGQQVEQPEHAGPAQEPVEIESAATHTFTACSQRAGEWQGSPPPRT